MTDFINNLTYYQKNKIAILQRSKNTMKTMKRKKGYARHRLQKMANEEKNKLNEHRRAWYNNLDEDKKNKIRKVARDRYYAISVC